MVDYNSKYIDEGSLVWLIITLSMTGKFLIAGTFALAYLYTAELFPTPVRLVENL